MTSRSLMTCPCGTTIDPGICRQEGEELPAGGHCGCVHRMELPAPCFICQRQLHPTFPGPDSDNTPSGATTFIAHGNYGSTVWDPASDSRWLEINICDVCLRERRHAILLAEHPAITTPPPIYRAFEGGG